MNYLGSLLGRIRTFCALVRMTCKGVTQCDSSKRVAHDLLAYIFLSICIILHLIAVIRLAPI